MDIRKYYDIREDISNLCSVQTKIDWVCRILEMYPNLSGMKLSDVKQWLSDKALDYEVRIQQEMGVRK